MLRDTEEFDRCTVAKQISEDIKQKECHTEDTRCKIATEIAGTVVEKECQTEKRREIIINTVRDILSKDDCVLEAYIFGNLVRSDFEETSDIDIYIIPSPECPIRTKYWYNEMIGEIDGHKIDCGVLHISKLEKGHISEWSRKCIQDDLRGYEPFIRIKSNTVVEKECGTVEVNLDTTKTDIPIFDMSILHADNPKKHYNCELKWLTPDEFLDWQCKTEGTTKEMFLRGVMESTVNSIIEGIKKGSVFNAFVLEFDESGKLERFQEGRHRIIAMKRLGIERVPVYFCKRIY